MYTNTLYNLGIKVIKYLLDRSKEQIGMKIGLEAFIFYLQKRVLENDTFLFDDKKRVGLKC